MNLESVAIQIGNMAFGIGPLARLYECLHPIADHIRSWARVLDNYDAPVTTRLKLDLIDAILVPGYEQSILFKGSFVNQDRVLFALFIAAFNSCLHIKRLKPPKTLKDKFPYQVVINHQPNVAGVDHRPLRGSLARKRSLL
jgi:hypothetical protein